MNRHFSNGDKQITSNYMTECSTSLVIREMQIKTTIRYHFIPTRMVIIKKTDNNKCCRGCGKIGMFIHCWWECKMGWLLWKTAWQFFRKLNIVLPYNPAISLLGIYPRKMKTYVHIKTFTQMFIAALYQNKQKVETT